MKPRIETLPEKKLVGKKLTMSFAANKTFELWSSFMPQRKEIKNQVGTNLYSVQEYPAGFYQNFSPHNKFTKRAAIEVTDFSYTPPDMESFVIPSGLYAVFNYKGKPSEATPFYNYIFTEWFPKSGYQPDERPHFEILGEKYKNEHPDSEEEIWIPIKRAK